VTVTDLPVTDLEADVRGIWIASSLALVSAPAAAATPAAFPIPTKAQIAQCPKLAGIDWKKVRRRIAKAERERPPVPAEADEFARHREIRGSRGLPDLSRAEIVLDVAIGSGETQEIPTSTSSFVWKEPGGQWQISRVDYTSWPPDPLPPGAGVMDEAWAEREQRPLTEGPLSPDQAEALDKVLADPCFAIQPAGMPWSLPMKDGTEQPCTGMIGGAVRMKTAAGVRWISDPCGRGYGFELSSLVMYGTLSTATWLVRTLMKKLGREDLEFADLKRGRPRGSGELVCGAVSAPGLPRQRFTWRRWLRGPYATEELVLESQASALGSQTFEQHWQGQCGGE
jgi:hypothetical protein